jgi:hypothetical protein
MASGMESKGPSVTGHTSPISTYIYIYFPLMTEWLSVMPVAAHFVLKHCRRVGIRQHDGFNGSDSVGNRTDRERQCSSCPGDIFNKNNCGGSNPNKTKERGFIDRVPWSRG